MRSGAGRARIVAVAAGVAIAIAGIAATRGGRAADAAWIDVARGAGAEGCPDAAALGAAIAAATADGRSDATRVAEGTRVHVTFTRGEGGLRATVRGEGRWSGTREFEGAAAACGDVARAVALAIAMALDAEGDAAAPNGADGRSATSGANAGAAGPNTGGAGPNDDPRGHGDAGANGAARPKETPTRVPPRATLRLDGLAAIGVVRTTAFGVGADVTIRPARVFALRAGAAFLPTTTLPLAPGDVRVGAIFGDVGACATADLGATRLGVAGCVGAAVGAVTGTSRGFAVNDVQTQLWLAARADAELTGPIAGPIGWAVRAGLAVPAERVRFEVVGAGVAYDPPAIAGIFGVGVGASIP